MLLSESKYKFKKYNVPTHMRTPTGCVMNERRECVTSSMAFSSHKDQFLPPPGIDISPPNALSHTT